MRPSRIPPLCALVTIACAVVLAPALALVTNQEAAELKSRLTPVARSYVISSGSPDEVTRDSRVLEAYLGSGHGSVAPEVSRAALEEVTGEQE